MIDNEQQISAEVKVQFTVKAARKAKIADPADNKITGISSDGYTTQSKIHLQQSERVWTMKVREREMSAIVPV